MAEMRFGRNLTSRVEFIERTPRRRLRHAEFLRLLPRSAQIPALSGLPVFRERLPTGVIHWAAVQALRIRSTESIVFQLRVVAGAPKSWSSWPR